jgi:two-component system chemotaxis sensor kinase CheA
MAYGTAAAFFELGSELLGADGFMVERELAFELTIGLGRSLMMLEQNERAESVLKALCAHELTPAELGVVYPSRCDNYSATADRSGAIEVGLEGLARLGAGLPPDPSPLETMPLLFSNQHQLAELTYADHVKRLPATDPRVLGALRILSTLTVPVYLSRRTNLYVLLIETAIRLILRDGHVQQTSGFLATHATLLIGALGQHDAARSSYEACLALERERPAPALYGRTTLVLYYTLGAWFNTWKESGEELGKGIERCIDAGDPMFAAMCASGSVTMQAMCGVPFERLAECLERWHAVMSADRALGASTANVSRLVGRFSRGEPITAEDLDPITNFPVEAGPMRNNPMVNFGLALAVVGHEAQVRSWLDAIRPTFSTVNFAQPQVANLWLLDGLFAAKHARLGQPERLDDARRITANMRHIVQKTGSTSLEPIIALLEAEIMRATGDLERAAGLYVHAVTQARAHERHHLVAFALEQRAQLLEQLGAVDEAALFYREAALAYQRWGHLTKVRELEAAHPELKAFDFAGYGSAGQVSLHTVQHRTTGQQTLHQPGLARTRSTLQATGARTLNAALDLSTVLNVSQEISTQLSASGVVRAVLGGIAQNAGAERALFVLCSESGEETVYAELTGGEYHEIGQRLSDYDHAPRSLLRLLRRTHKPVVIADATADPGHATDPFVIASRCRSLAGIPVLKSNAVAGFVVLENRLVAGAFTEELVDLTQALVAQAAISLDNASLYENMEHRVRERTAELHGRNVEMRRVLDNVAQGLVTIDRDGRLSRERSAIFEQWFPGGLPDTVRGLFASDSKVVALFDLGWEQLLEGILPLELCVEQMPKQLERGQRNFELGWRPIAGEHDQLERMLLVMSDVTEVRLRQRSEREQLQLMALVERVGQDRNGVLEFMRESQELLRELEREEPDRDLERRRIHTLKGNCSLFGVSVVSALCHEIETALELDQRRLSEEEQRELRSAWSDLERRLLPFLDTKTSTLQVIQRDFEAALQKLQRENHPLVQELEMWTLEPLELRFQRIGEHADRLAQRFNKGALRIRNEHGGFRVAGEAWAGFWAAFAHAVRNAVDHGIESSDERHAAGKDVATLTLRAYPSGGRFVFEFSDDGRGIAWDKIRAKALLAGLPAETPEDLAAALFACGISSKDSADELSGRGIGMPALQQACRALGGAISVESTPGQGTTWRFDFPAELAKAPRERRTSVRPSLAPVN